MWKKITAVLKNAIIIWLGILIPLVVAYSFINSATKSDAEGCADTFVTSENANIAKYISLLFDNTAHNLEELQAELSKYKIAEKKGINNAIKAYIKQHAEIKRINVYGQDGKFIVGSDNEYEFPFGYSSKESLQGVHYLIGQEDNKKIFMNYVIAHNFEGSKDAYRLVISVDWKHYEKYMTQISEGSFPRMFYVLSPECKRYVSFNSLPKEHESLKNVAALGLHLASKISKIKNGTSNLDIDNYNFKLMKREIKFPKNMVGGKFYIVTATDDYTIKQISKELNGKLHIVLYILLALTFAICVIVSKLYNNIKNQLEIANRIADSTPLAIVIFDHDNGKINRINSVACSLLKVQTESINDVDIWNIFISKEDIDYIKSAIASDLSIFNYEVLIQSCVGDNFWAICSVSTVSIYDQKLVVLGVLDINRRKEVEKKLANNAEMLEQQIAERTADLEKQAKQLEESNAMLEKAKASADLANNAKSKFLTNVTNELQTPLNAIIGYSEILHEEAMDRKDNVSADDLRKIMGSAKHLLSLINEILDLSKIEAGKTQLFFEDVSVENIIKDVESVIMPMVADNNNSLFLEYPKDIGMMYTDTTKLRQCLLNILSNAAKFTEFGKITLRVSASVKAGEDFVVFSTIDTGVGIASDQLEHIFDSFQESSSKHAGAGLGLSIAKQYIGYLGGTIEVESEVGVGSKFTIKVPRVCKTESSDTIEIKNQKHDDEELEKFIDASEAEILRAEDTEATTWTRTSDNKE